ncbi:MAG: hypothetical protein GX542_13050 [Rhodococcus sp.]|nr:hypothetical protein [Rhodococcus sp. (in: high G+C Gram-positive bacteria)]
MDAKNPNRDAVVLVDAAAPSLLPSIHRVAAAAGRSVHEIATPQVDAGAWESAALIVLDSAAAARCRGLLRRRTGIVIVSAGPPGLTEWKAATEIGADSVLGLPADETALMTAMAETSPLRGGSGAVISVVGGCGGAGASTFAAALASVASSGSDAAFLIDADALGPGLDVTLGLEREPGMRWSGLHVESGRVSGEALSDALPRTPDGVRVLSCDHLHGRSNGPTVASLRAVLAATRSVTDLTVCDMPRPSTYTASTDIGEALLSESDLVVLVVPATVPGCVAAEKMAARLVHTNPNVGLVVRGPAPGGLRAADVARAIDRPILAAMRADRSVAAMLDRDGFRLRARSPLAGAARAVLSRLADRPQQSGWAA